MFKVVKVVGSRVVIGDTETSEAMYISLDDCYDGISEGDIVDVFKGEGLVIVTLKEVSKEKRSFLKQSTSESKVDDLSKDVEELTKANLSVPSLDASSTKPKATADLVQPAKMDASIKNEDKKEEPKMNSQTDHLRSKKSMGGYIVVSVIAIALAFATLQLAGPFLNSENLKAYNLVVDSLKQESTSERVSLPSFYQFKFYPIPEILSDAFFGDMLVMGHTINGQVSTLVMCGVSFETEEAICNIDQAEVE